MGFVSPLGLMRDEMQCPGRGTRWLLAGGRQHRLRTGRSPSPAPRHKAASSLAASFPRFPTGEVGPPYAWCLQGQDNWEASHGGCSESCGKQQEGPDGARSNPAQRRHPGWKRHRVVLVPVVLGRVLFQRDGLNSAVRGLTHRRHHVPRLRCLVLINLPNTPVIFCQI